MTDKKQTGTGAAKKAAPASKTTKASTTQTATIAEPVGPKLQPGKQVIIRPLKSRTWSGFHRFPKCQDTIIAQKNRGGYNTGLSRDEQTMLENEMRLPEGTLHPNSDFWKTYVFRLGDKDTILDMGIAVDYINLSLCKVEKRVANSLSTKHETPKAEYVIYDIVEDARNENKSLEDKIRAASIFGKLSQADQVDYLTLMGHRATHTQPEVVKNQLYKALENDPGEFLRIADLPDRATRVLINGLVQNNILRVQGGHYMHGTIDIGYDLATAVAYIDDPMNQDLKVNLMQQLEATRKIRY